MPVVDADVLILIPMDDMDRTGIHLINPTNHVHDPASGRYGRVMRLHSHPFLDWDPANQFHFTTGELHCLHCRFGHPVSIKLANYRSHTNLHETPGNSLKMLQEIENAV